MREEQMTKVTDIKRPRSAYTKYPNTPETDMERKVMHVVKFSDGSMIELMATDPSDALDQAYLTLEPNNG